MDKTITLDYDILTSGDTAAVIQFATSVAVAFTDALKGHATYVSAGGGVIAAIVPPDRALVV